MKMKEICYIQGPRRGSYLHTIQEATQEELCVSGLSVVGEKQREYLWAGTFIWNQSGVYKQRGEVISLMYLNVTRSQSGEGKKGNLWQRPTLLIILPYWVTWVGFS